MAQPQPADTNQRADLRRLIERIAKALVDAPEQVTVREISGEQSTILELRVAKDDLGKVIGREGRTAHSLRVIVGAVGMKIKRRYYLEILE